jgi:hypothetical protein
VVVPAVTAELDRLLEVCDPGIRKAVRVLREAGVDTFQSCEGGPRHCDAEPNVDFGRGRRPEDGWKALAVALENRLSVLYLRLQWNVEFGHPTGPY